MAAGFVDVLRFVWGWKSSSTAVVVVPDQPGLEFTLPENRMQYTLAENRMHGTLPQNRFHFVTPEED